MKSESGIAPDALAAQYNQLIEESLRLNYLVRDAVLQQHKVDEIDRFRLVIKSAKQKAIARREEKTSNAFFLFQCVLNSLRSVLLMWIKLKSNEPADAWGHLVDAQDYVSVALRIPTRGSWGIPDLAKRLSDIEQVVFPGWPVFISPGFIEDVGNCSICGQNYADCAEHLEGFVYFGQLCERLDRQIREGRHVAFVQKPKDKRCIIKYISTDDGSKKDYITLKVLNEKFEKPEEDKSLLRAEAIILNLRRLDFD